MNVKVTGNEVRPPQGGGAGGVSAKRDAAEPAGASSKSSPVVMGDAVDSTVQIGATTRHLMDLAKTSSAADVVDMAKVERLRAAIADGSYQVEGQKVADQLLRFEVLLGRVTGDLQKGS